jgi:hypothetical protein
MNPPFKKTSPWQPFVFLAAVLVVFLAQPILAAPIQWTGSSNNNWDNAGNWKPTTVPGAGDDASLTSIFNKTATLNAVTPLLNSVIVEGWPWGTFTLNESGGAYALSATAETIGLWGKGVYNQSGGNNTVGSSAGTVIAGKTLQRTLVLGFNNGSSGTYNMGGGNLTTYNLMVGRRGTGHFNQSSTNVTVNNDLTVGRYGPGHGTYGMSGGALTVKGDETVGWVGNGTFTQASSLHTIGGNLFVGRSLSAGKTRTFEMLGGSLQVGKNAYIGKAGTGTFSMSGGDFSVDGNEFIGGFTSSIPLFSTVGTGSFAQIGGNHIIKGNLIIGDSLGSAGSYTMTGGSLSVAGDEFIGNYGSATFTQNGGSHSANSIALAINGQNGVTYNLNSGTVSAPNGIAIFYQTFQTQQGGIFNVTGTSTVDGRVYNFGLVNTKDANVTWNGPFKNQFSYISDHSTQIFSQDLEVLPGGFLQGLAPLDAQGNPQEVFILASNFLNNGGNPSLWNTDTTEIKFIGAPGTNHTFEVAGVDNGKPAIPNNFNWYTLDITGQNLYLKDPDGDGGAQYVGVVTGWDITGSTVNNIFGDPDSPLNLYYVPALNPLLNDLTYTFANGFGQLIPDDNTVFLVPEAASLAPAPLPPSLLLFGSGLLGMGLVGWRKKRLKGF